MFSQKLYLLVLGAGGFLSSCHIWQILSGSCLVFFQFYFFFVPPADVKVEN